MTRGRLRLFSGAVFVLLAVGAVYAMGTPLLARISAAVSGRGVAPGFVGIANFGHWRLICVPGPSLQSLPGAPDAKAMPVANACRVNQEVPAPQPAPAAGQSTTTPVTTRPVTTRPAPAPAEIVVAANFSEVGARRTPALMLRLPPTARAGDVIALRFGSDFVVNTKVRECSASECLAASALTAQDWARVMAAATLQISFPAAGRQWVLVDLPVEGLAAAAAAMDRAVSATRL